MQRSEESRYDHRLHGVLLVAQGMTCPEVARLLGDAPRAVEDWFHAGTGRSDRGRAIRTPAPTEPKTGERNPSGVAAKTERRGDAGPSLGWQDAVGMDRENLWNPTGR